MIDAFIKIQYSDLLSIHNQHPKENAMSSDELESLVRDIQKIPTEIISFIHTLEKAGGTGAHIDWIRDPRNAIHLIQFINREFVTNHFAMTVEAQIEALRRANEEEKWEIEEEVFTRLQATAPAWPEGRESYRSFRIRFGKGAGGVELTFYRHLGRMKSVFAKLGHGFCSSDVDRHFLFDGKNFLRLRDGSHTHKPVIEWIIADLNKANRRYSTRSKNFKPLADELLVLAWMFPHGILATIDEARSELLALGYEANKASYDRPKSITIGHWTKYRDSNDDLWNKVHVGTYRDIDSKCPMPFLVDMK